MIKTLSALAVLAFVATALFVLPGFAPPLDAGPALQKGDRLITRASGNDCSKQMWPNFSLSCLRGKGVIPAARLVQARG